MDGDTSCTTPAGACESGPVDVGACSKGPPRHFRVFGLVPDGVTAVSLEKFGGAVGRTVPVIENTVAFTIGRENVVLHGSGDAAAEELERTLPPAHAAERSGGDDRAGCSSCFFAEARTPN